MLSAHELHERGKHASNAGQYAAARRLLTASYGRGSTDDELSLAQASLAYVVAETGDVSGGLRMCGEALGRAGISARARGIVVSQRGLLLMRRGEADRAIEDLTEAIAALEDEPEYAGRFRLNRGNAHLQHGRLDEAEADFTLAEAGLRSAGLPVQQAKAGYNRGYARLLMGDLATALRLMEQPGEYLGSLGPVGAATVAQDRAEALLACGLVDDGLRSLREASRAYGARGLRQFQGEAELVEARTLLPDDPIAARTVAKRAATRFRRHGSESWGLRAEAVSVLADVQAGGRAPALLRRADELAGTLRDQRLETEQAQVQLAAARVLLRRDRLDEAGRRLRQVRVPESAPIGVRLLHREVRADLARARGRRTRSLDELRAGLRELHDWQSSFGSLDLQSSLVEHGRQLVVDGLRLALATRRPDLLLEWTDRARALTSRVTEVRPPGDPRLAEELTELRLLTAGVQTPGSPAAARARHLRNHIRRHAWYDDRARRVAEPLGLDTLQAVLARDDAAFVAHVEIDDTLWALVVTGTSAEVVALGPATGLDSLMGGLAADLDMYASEESADLREIIGRGLHQRLGRLDDLLVGPLLPVLGDRRLVLAPPGSLVPVPWTMLPSLAGRPVTVPPSATVWAAAREETRPAPRSIGFVAGPHVPRSVEEVQRAAASWAEAAVIEPGSATAERVAGLAERSDVLHLAVHGQYVAENPLFSSVWLGDGAWFGYDVDQLARVPSLVVLSACELGRTAVRGQGYLVGLTAAWLHAGADCVIAAPSLVNDADACDLLPRVHAALAAGLPPSDALARGLDEVGRPVPFVCHGSGW
ncbi:MAG: CHAT domain-containing protein [Nocardioides sp.]